MFWANQKTAKKINGFFKQIQDASHQLPAPKRPTSPFQFSR